MASFLIDKNRFARLMPLLVFILTFAVFLPALKNGFVNWDDVYNLVENPNYRGLGREQLKWMFTTFQSGPYQPLSWLTLGLDYLVWGMDPFGYHLTNVLLHSLNAAVFCLLCVKLFELSVEGPLAGKAAELGLAAGFAALFFSLHPLRVESVAWVTERRDVLCGLFYLLALLLYIGPRSPGGEKAPGWRRHGLPLAAFLLALLAKGMAVTLPAALIVLDIYPLGRLPASPRSWFARENRVVWPEKIPFFALAAVFGAVGYACQESSGALDSYEKFGLAPRLAQVLFGTVFYMQKTLLPEGLSPLYRLADGSVLNARTLFSGAAFAAATGAAIYLRRRWPAVPAVWACYLAALVPVAGLVKFGFQSAADRYTYIPCLGFAVLAGAGLFACRQAAEKRLRQGCAVAAVLILAGLARLTWRQQGVWLNSETLWTHALAVNPELELAHNNLGEVLAAQGRTGEATWHYLEALRLNPESAFAHYNLGGLQAAQGRFAEAEGHNRAALRIKPAFALAHYNLGVVLAAQGKMEDAAAHYREAVKLAPDFALAKNNLSLILAGQGKTGKSAGALLPSK